MIIAVINIIIDILASAEVDACLHNIGPIANIRDRTMHVIVAVLDLLVKDGNKVFISSYFFLFLHYRHNISSFMLFSP